MVTSRCGVRCDACQRREQVHCQGCINMAAPFWGGICEVKSCVESKSLEHCGQCDKFPCETLSTMGVKEGFDPQIKIAQCRIWLAEE